MRALDQTGTENGGFRLIGHTVPGPTVAWHSQQRHLRVRITKQFPTRDVTGPSLHTNTHVALLLAVVLLTINVSLSVKSNRQVIPAVANVLEIS